VIGLGKVWRSSEATYFAIRLEHANALIPAIEQVRPNGPFYIHDPLTQGHTVNGQILGAPALYAGSGSSVRADRYSSSGRLTVRAERIVRDARGGGLLHADDEVSYSLAPEILLFRRSAELTAGISATRVLNADFSSKDRWNLGFTLSWHLLAQ
jgi:hypothetical protein